MTPPLFFVLLGDPFLCEEKRKEIISGLEKRFQNHLSLKLCRAGETELESILAEARTLPFLVPAQVFIFRDAEKFSKNDLTLLGRYFASPAQGSFFIFEAEALDSNHPLTAWAREVKQLFFLESQSASTAARFIQQKLQQAGKKMTREAQVLLESRVGESLIFLDSLLDQIVLWVGERAVIEAADIEVAGEQSLQFEGSDLLDALGRRELRKALQILNELLEDNFRDFPATVGLLHWQLRRFWDAKRWEAQGLPEKEIAFRLKLSPSRASSFFRSLRQFSLENLEEILTGLFELDWQLKTGQAGGRPEIEAWLVRTIG